MKLVEIGKKISELRNEMNLTQGELAEGICTQASISLIEKGELDPNATSLYQISKKLGVDVNYFFHIGSTPRLDYITEVEKQVRKLRILNEFEEMMNIVSIEEKNPLFYNDPKNLQFLYWHKSIYYSEVKNDHQQAVSILEEAFALFPNKKRATTELEIEMMLTIGIYEFSLGNYEVVIEEYGKIQKILDDTNRVLNDKSIKTRLYYNLARAHTRLGNLEESTALLIEGIDWCIECEELYLLAALHYQIGYNYELLGDYENALEYMDYCILLYALTPEHPVNNGFLTEKRTGYLDALKKQ
ncbi:helix-turn-helix transcriptional regulator [Rossellomorea marisflavi]|uniref:helix-turn-helix transcriptional regulator n=2 Tax=Rossellomorea marisflavi TaxID=189381 RepID=UPI00069EAE19|nr:helix-turn-helix transcriptional regulator [Rossellomorea marisflavi]TYO69479.1 helix-turn-helix transcriptional regulator [Rossellomorea marisflavi]